MIGSYILTILNAIILGGMVGSTIVFTKAVQKIAPLINIVKMQRKENNN